MATCWPCKSIWSAELKEETCRNAFSKLSAEAWRLAGPANQSGQRNSKKRPVAMHSQSCLRRHGDLLALQINLVSGTQRRDLSQCILKAVCGGMATCWPCKSIWSAELKEETCRNAFSKLSAGTSARNGGPTTSPSPPVPACNWAKSWVGTCRILVCSKPDCMGATGGPIAWAAAWGAGPPTTACCCTPA